METAIIPESLHVQDFIGDKICRRDHPLLDSLRRENDTV
jgi:hypothetical protein